MIIIGTCDEAVKAGKIREHRLADIELADNGTKHDRTDFVFPEYAQVKFVADGVHAAFFAACVRVSDAEQGRADYRCGALARAS